MATETNVLQVGPPPGIPELQNALAILARQGIAAATSLDRYRKSLLGVASAASTLGGSLNGLTRSLGTATGSIRTFGAAADDCARRLATAAATLNSVQVRPGAAGGGGQRVSAAEITAGTVNVAGPININGEQGKGATLGITGEIIQSLGSLSEIGMGMREAWRAFRPGGGPAGASPAGLASMTVGVMTVTRMIGGPSGGGTPGAGTPGAGWRRRDSGLLVPTSLEGAGRPRSRIGSAIRRIIPRGGFGRLLAGAGVLTAASVLGGSQARASTGEGAPEETGGDGFGAGDAALAAGGAGLLGVGGYAAYRGMQRRRSRGAPVALTGMAGGAMEMAGGLVGSGRGSGGGLMGRGGGMLGMVGKGLKMFSPVGLGMMAGGMVSTMIADRMAASGVQMPEPGAFAGGVGALTGFDPRLIQMGIDFLNTVPGLLSQAWAAISAVVAPWAESFAGLMQNIVSGAQNIWNSLATFFTTTLPGLFTQGVESIKGVFGTLATFFTETVPAAFVSLGQRMVELKDNLVGLAAEAVGKVQNFFGNLGAFFTETLPARFQQFLATFGEWRTQLVGLAGQIVSEFVERVQGIGTFFLETLPGMLRNGARGVINALIDGLVAAARHIPGVGAMVAQKLADYLQGHSPPKLGPLSKIIQGGYNVMIAWAQGLASASGPVRSVATWLGDTVAGLLGRRRRSAAEAVLPGVQPTLAGTAPPAGTETDTRSPDGERREPGMLGQIGNLLGEKFGGLISSLGPLGMVATLLEGVFQGLAPLIDALKEPLRIVGEIFGKGFAPILKALFPVFKLVAIAATYIGQVFFIVAAGIAKAIGGVIKAIGWAIDKIPFMSDLGLKKFGQGLIDTGKGFDQSAKDLAEGREEIKKLKFGETAAAAKETAESLRNLPEGFKIALARFNAAAPATVPGPTGVSAATVPEYAPGSGVPVPSNPVTIEQVHIVSDNPEKIWHELRGVIEREGLRHYGNPMAYAIA